MNVFNSVSDIANILLEFSFSNRQFFEYLSILQDIKLEDFNNYIVKNINQDNSSLSIVTPK